jgi:hypothetical protein
MASAGFGVITATKRIPGYISNCLHMNFHKSSYVKSGISLLLVTYAAGCDISLLGNRTNQLFERSVAIQFGFFRD